MITLYNIRVSVDTAKIQLFPGFGLMLTHEEYV